MTCYLVGDDSRALGRGAQVSLASLIASHLLRRLLIEQSTGAEIAEAPSLPRLVLCGCGYHK